MNELDFVDVARYQKDVPWNLFRDAGVGGAMARVSEGYFLPPNYTGHIDAYFPRNWQALENFGLRGATHYIRFDKNRTGGLTPADQVNMAINEVEAQPSKRKPADILALDVEQNPKQIAHISKLARAQMLAEAFREAEKRWDKEYIWNYTGKWWWDDQMPAPHVEPMPYLLSFKCWAAYYTIFNLSTRMVPNGWELKDVIAHQYSAKKQIEGIVVDHNEFKFDWDSYLKLDIDVPEPLPVPPIPEPIPPTPTPTPTPVPPREPRGCLPALLDIITTRKTNG